jgi:hypothetical protein
MPNGSEEHVVVVSTAHRKLEEMKVELAWHADLSTFSYELVARIEGDHMEVRGYVPNEAIKEKALGIARKHTPFPIVDKLKLMPNLAARSVGRPAEEVKEEAARLLAEKLGDEARSFEVKVTGVGEVALAGTVHSVEDKLAVSHLLRQVHGCGCVANHLAVAPELRNGRMMTAVTHDGKETIGGKLPDLEAVVESEGHPVEGQPMLVAPAPMPAPMGGHVPLGQPVKRVMPSKSMEKTPFAIDSVPAPSVPTPLVLPSKEGNDLPPPRLVPPTPAKSALPPPVPVPTTKWRPPMDNAAVTRNDFPSDPLVVPPQPAPVPSTKRKPATENAATTKHDFASDPLAVPDLPPSWSKKAPVGSAKGSDFATVGHEAEGKSESKVLPAASKGELKADKPKPDKAADPHGATGMVFFDDEPRPAVPSSQALPMAPAALKQRIEAVCGTQARSVQVVVEPDSSLRVKVTLADPQQERMMTQRILALPEMNSPRVHLETIR